jgi:hypothetical protein
VCRAGATFLTWRAAGYEITLRFAGDVCDGVVGETSWQK